MTENAKINEVLRVLFALPISAEQRLGAFFLWGMMLPEDPRAAENARKRREKHAWRLKHPEKYAEQNRTQYWNDPDNRRAAVAVWRKENPEQMHAVHKLWLQENPGKVAAIEKRRDKTKKRARMQEYCRARRGEDPEFKLLTNTRTRINRALKTLSKGAGTRALIGMDIREYRIYLQGQFLPGMTWENHGDVWHIDHVKPCASFDLTDPAQQRECFHWSNTQPLFAKENLEKGATYVPVG